MTRRVLLVTTNVSSYEDESHPTGLWLSELTHAWEMFEGHGFELDLMSPLGGLTPLEPRSLRFPNADASTRAWLADPARTELLDSTLSPEQVSATDYDAVFLTGGHAVMFDFPGSEGLQQVIRDVWEAGGIVSSVCHGYCGLLTTRLSDGSPLLRGRRMTGFSWAEEVLAGVSRLVPYNAEGRARAMGALYGKGLLPFVPHVVTDGRLVTGQNPASARRTAQAVAALLA